MRTIFYSNFFTDFLEFYSLFMEAKFDGKLNSIEIFKGLAKFGCLWLSFQSSRKQFVGQCTENSRSFLRHTYICTYRYTHPFMCQNIVCSMIGMENMY